METTLPAVFNSSSFPSAMNAALTYPFTVSRSILRTITFLCVVDIGAESNRSADCRTFAQNVPQGSYFVAKSSTFVLLFVLRRRRCTWPLSSVESELQVSQAPFGSTALCCALIRSRSEESVQRRSWYECARCLGSFICGLRL